MTQPTLINVHLNKHRQEFHYYPFLVKLDRCVRSCNALNDFSNQLWVPNKTKNSNTTQPRKLFVLSLHYNESNSFLFINATKLLKSLK